MSIAVSRTAGISVPWITVLAGSASLVERTDVLSLANPREPGSAPASSAGAPWRRAAVFGAGGHGRTAWSCRQRRAPARHAAPCRASASSRGMGFIPGAAPTCGVGSGHGPPASPSGWPGMVAGIGTAGLSAERSAAGAAAGVVAPWRLELSETKVAQPRTSAIAPPAARPRLSRRVLRVATIG